MTLILNYIKSNQQLNITASQIIIKINLFQHKDLGCTSQSTECMHVNGV